MKIWNRLGAAGLVAGALAFGGGTHAHAACINTATHTVDTAADCVFADGGDADNRLAISINWDGAGNPPPDPKKMSCTDGDPTCDRDGAVNGRCEFLIGACVNIPGGAADTVSSALVTKPSQKEVDNAVKTPQAAYTRNDLQFALNSILPSAVETCTDDDISVRVPMKSKGGTCHLPADQKCTNDNECTDYCVPIFKKNKANVALEVADTGKGAKAKFKFTCNPDEDGFTNGAQAFVISNPADLIGGPLAMGKVGDYMIRNGNVRAVVRAPGREHSFMLQNGGQIIDADLERIDPADDRDSFQGIQPMINTASSQATDTMSVFVPGSDGNAAIIRSSGPDDLLDSIKGDVLILAAGLALPNSAVDVDLPVQLTTDIILPPYSNKIEMATTVQNTSGSPLNIYIGDFINPSGQLEPFGPSQGYGEQQLRNGTVNASGGQPLDFMAYQGMLDAAGVTYGVIFPATDAIQKTTKKTGVFSSSGVNVWVHNNDLLNGVLFPDADAAKQIGGFQVPANGTKTLRRWFTVGETVADVSRERQNLYGELTASVQGVVTVGGEPVAGAHVTILNNSIPYSANCTANTNNCKNIYSSTVTDQSGFYRLTAPVGNWTVVARKTGAPYETGSTPTQHAVVLEEKKTTIQNIDFPGTGTVAVNCKDQANTPIACKVSVVGVPASPDPLNDEYTGLLSVHYTGRYFGYDYEEKGDVFGLAHATFTDTTGSTSFNLEPGTYRVVVSHGYEYDVYDDLITVTDGGTSNVVATVHQVVDTTGFVSIDTHVHMINSPDSTISHERRINSMIAEGVDFFVNTDHDFAHDLSAEITAMGVGSLIANRPSAETTTSHYGHFNMWPITVNSEIDGGAYDWSSHNGLGDGYPTSGRYDSNPTEIFAAGAAYPGTQVIQINHFNSGTLGHFNMLGIDTEQNPPVSSNQVYRCVGGATPNRPCRVQICLGGTNDGNSCTVDANCPGGGTCPTVSACSGGGVCTLQASLGSFLRLDPSTPSYYGDNFTALEVWIEAGRDQTNTLLSDNMADWFNLLNQGRYKAGTADSDTHSMISVQSGGPRTFVASSTDAPGSIDPEELATNVNGLRAVGSNGPFMRVTLENGALAQAGMGVGQPQTVAYTGGGADKVKLHIESPTWAEYDRIDLYMNSTPSCKSEWTFFGVVNPSKCSTVTPTMTLNKGVDFAVTPTTGVSGSGTRLVTDVTIPVTISADTWVVAVVHGTDGVSHPLFPMQPQDLDTTGNDTLNDLTDSGGPIPWNLGEDGALALAYSNPLFFDDGDLVCNGGTACP